MKKLLVLVLGAGLVLSLGSMAFGAVNVSGELKYKYSDTFDAKKVDSTSTNDTMEGKIILESQIDKELYAFLAAKAARSDSDTDFNADEYYITYAPGVGTLKVGLWGYGTKGKIDVIDAAFGDLKSDVAFSYNTKVADLIDVAAWVSPDAALKQVPGTVPGTTRLDKKYDEATEDFAYAVKAGINKEQWGVEANYIDTKITTADPGYTVNGYFVPVKDLTLYGQLGVDQGKDETQIIGVSYKAGALLARFEYDIEKYNGDPDGGANAEWETNPMGLKFVYAGPHGIEYEAGYKVSETKTSENKELWASAKFTLK